jgi:hypothetical protein
MAASQELHPTAAQLLLDEESLNEDKSYFRKLGVKYEADALIELLTRQKPKSAMPVACHSLADLNAKHAVPVLKTLADYSVQDVKALKRPCSRWPDWPDATRHRGSLNAFPGKGR